MSTGSDDPLHDPTLTPSALALTETAGPTEEPGRSTVRPGRGAVPGYQLGALIGRGGMGEVIAARDERIGREVAIKRLRANAADAAPHAVARFLREAIASSPAR